MVVPGSQNQFQNILYQYRLSGTTRKKTHCYYTVGIVRVLLRPVKMSGRTKKAYKTRRFISL